ncbi:CBS domain-containing protein [Candidatus Nitrosopumilus sp. SW]|uniref:CBS domain-containing protein n=1 Tax=Candidatus Nitrosopumilus sp. SW TaxID=2508726 RepID=UPI0011516B8A|nr:CBS domain-containing protein [Candidatus Nitrosopumilus sp. SW]QDI89514.1 CBS domain-containing protein [Candidatus Nitrosopumilus sp. SW]
MTQLKSIMKTPITIQNDASLSHAISKLLQENISRLLVKENDHYSIITEKDIGFFLLNDDSEKNLDEIPVSQIMKRITSVNDAMAIETCIEIMLERGIGSLAVTRGDEGIVGIITKTDIAQYYVQNCVGSHTVGDLMTISYLSMQSDDYLKDVVSKMIEEKISRIFLKNKNNEPEGILTFRDLFHIALEQGNSDSVLDNSDDSISVVFSRKGFLSDSGFGKTIQAKDVMTKTFESVDFKEDLSVACEEMIQNRINGVGVLINGKLGGVVSKTDVLKAIYVDNKSKKSS